MNIRQALAEASSLLADNSIEEAELESEVLLRHTLGLNRVQLYLVFDDELDIEHHNLFHDFIERRLQGEPSAYITGHREFYALDFLVDSRVLIPRPESELLVEKAIETAGAASPGAVVDVGTGCGAIAVCLALNLAGVKIYATDISADALEVARENAARHGVAERIDFLQGDLLEPLPSAVGLIVANLPYVRRADMPEAGPVSYEPALALDGGEEGLDKIETLCNQAAQALTGNGRLLLEIGEGQAGTVQEIIRGALPTAKLEVYRDLSGIERVVGAGLTGSRT